MAASNIAVDGGESKLLQSFENTVGGDSVHSEAVTLVYSDGTAIHGNVSRSYFLANTAATVDAFTPTASTKFRLRGFSITARAGNTADVLVTLKWKTSGDIIHRQKLSQYGGAYGENFGDDYTEGATDELIEVTLDAAQSVDIGIRYTEV